MKREIRYKMYRIVSMVLMLAILLECKICVNAEAENTLKSDVADVTRMIGKIMEDQLGEKEEELRQVIENHGYDVSMTMESFYENGNPFLEVDYLKLIAWYASIKEQCLKAGLPINEGFSSVQLLSMNITEKQLTENTPVIVKEYEEVADGIYKCTGTKKISKIEMVGIYEIQKDGFYIKIGEQQVYPVEEKLLYGEVQLLFTGYECLCKAFSVKEEDIRPKADKIYKQMKNAIDGRTLSQSVFIKMPRQISEQEKVLAQSLINSVEDLEMKAILEVAVSLIGQVPYQWGGKAQTGGYDTSWWLYDETGQQKGLDCSGYIQWIFLTCGYSREITDQLISTSAMQSLVDVSEEELQPGDIGLLNHGETTNHTGIYLGDGYFVHCSSEMQTVTISKFPFRYFKRVLLDKNFIDKNGVLEYPVNKYTNSVIVAEECEKYTKSANDKEDQEFGIQLFSDNRIDASEEEIYLFAQLIHSEAGNQGYNGMVAVGEVVINRARSPKFKETTIKEVILADGQFSNSENLKKITPTEEELAVAQMLVNGMIAVFHNPDVLYFKNPMITDGIRPDIPYDWGKHKWYAAVNEHAFYLG